MWLSGQTSIAVEMTYWHLNLCARNSVTIVRGLFDDVEDPSCALCSPWCWITSVGIRKYKAAMPCGLTEYRIKPRERIGANTFGALEV